MRNLSFADYEAPVYLVFNKDGSWCAAAGHISSTLYTHLDIQKKIYNVLPDEMKESGNFPRVAHQYIVYRFLEMLIYIQNQYREILNPLMSDLTEAQRRNLKNSASAMRVQAVCRQQQELFHPLTYEIIEPYITNEDSTAIDAWIQRIGDDSAATFNEIVNNFNNTIGIAPYTPVLDVEPVVEPADYDDSPF